MLMLGVMDPILYKGMVIQVIPLGPICVYGRKDTTTSDGRYFSEIEHAFQWVDEITGLSRDV